MRIPNGKLRLCKDCKFFVRSPIALGVNVSRNTQIATVTCRSIGISALDFACLSFLPAANHRNGANRESLKESSPVS